MNSGKVILDVKNAVATVTINRPDRLNAIDPEMLDALMGELNRIEDDIEIRVVLLTGAGDRAFCVGGDIHAWGSLDPIDMWRRWIPHGHRVFDRLARLRQPVIAAVNGYALGGGLELALCADIRISSESAVFAMPEVKLGTIPGWAGTQRLSNLIGPARAKQMIFTGGQIDAQTASQWGLVNEVVSPAALLSHSETIAREIAGNAPLSVQMAKQLIDAGSQRTTDFAPEAIASGMAAMSRDGREGVAAFREKRVPQFEGT